MSDNDMVNQASGAVLPSTVPVLPSTVPHIVVTEPSPVSIPSQNAVSVVSNIQPIPEDAATGTEEATSESVNISLEQAAAIPGPSNKSSGEFEPAQECDECVVPVPDQSASQSSDDQTTTTETEDDFRSPGARCWRNYGMRFTEYYKKVWKIMHTGWAIPFWLCLMCFPITAGCAGAIHMHECPACRSLPQLVFTIAISTLVLFTLRVCLILRKYTTREMDETKKMLHSLISITTVLSVVFFVTESVTFWKLPPTDDMYGNPNYCEPAFLDYCFWWNCIMSVIMVLVFIFPF